MKTDSLIIVRHAVLETAARTNLIYAIAVRFVIESIESANRTADLENQLISSIWILTHKSVSLCWSEWRSSRERRIIHPRSPPYVEQDQVMPRAGGHVLHLRRTRLIRRHILAASVDLPEAFDPPVPSLRSDGTGGSKASGRSTLAARICRRINRVRRRCKT